MNFITWLWHRRQRKIDLEILWPAIKSQARDLLHARAMFQQHMNIDSAWRRLEEAQKRHVLDRLE